MFALTSILAQTAKQFDREIKQDAQELLDYSVIELNRGGNCGWTSEYLNDDNDKEVCYFLDTSARKHPQRDDRFAARIIVNFDRPVFINAIRTRNNPPRRGRYDPFRAQYVEIYKSETEDYAQEDKIITVGIGATTDVSDREAFHSRQKSFKVLIVGGREIVKIAALAFLGHV